MNDVEKAINESLFFLGAGISQKAGCKTSSEMLREIENKYSSGPRKEAIDFLISCLAYHTVWKSKKQNALKYTPNIEELVLLLRRIVAREDYLPYPITGSWSDKINILESIEKDIFRNILQEIEELLNNWLEIKSKSDIEYLAPIKHFMQAYPRDKFLFDIFTINYDLIFEKYFNDNSLTLLARGFTKGKWEGMAELSESQETLDTERIFYYKLHGSLDWCKLEDGSIREKNSIASDDHVLSSNLRIFGSGNKFLSIDPFLSLIYNFRKKLEDKKYFFVIGYSFFDPYINNLLIEALYRNSDLNKKVIIVNPWIIEEYENNTGTGSEFGKEEFEITDSDLNRFIDKIKEIQQSNFLSDLPDFNITNLSKNLIKIIPLKAEKFLEKYFSNNGKEFINLVKDFDSEAAALERFF